MIEVLSWLLLGTLVLFILGLTCLALKFYWEIKGGKK